MSKEGEGEVTVAVEVTIRSKDQWPGWWFEMGETFMVRLFDYRAWHEATVESCSNPLCNALFEVEMYEVICGPFSGALIPAEVTRNREDSSVQEDERKGMRRL